MDHKKLFVSFIQRAMLSLGLFFHLTIIPAMASDFRIIDFRASSSAVLSLSAPELSGTVVEDRVVDYSLDSLAYSRFDTDIFGVIFARAAAFQSTNGLNSTYAELSEYVPEIPTDVRVTAGTSYGTSVRATTSLVGQVVPLNFVINGGQLRVDNFSDFQPDGDRGGAFVSAAINLSSTAKGVGVVGALWRYTARLTKDPVSQQMVVTEGRESRIDLFGIDVFPTLNIETVDADGDGEVDDAIVDIPRFEGSLLLDGEVFGAPIDVVNIGYEMSSVFEAPHDDLNLLGNNTSGGAGISDPFALGTPLDPSDDLGGPFGPEGVQFFLDGTPLGEIPVVVPLPAAFWVFILSLGVLGSSVRRTPAKTAYLES